MSPFVWAIVLLYGPTAMCDIMNRNDPSNKSKGGSSRKDRNAFFALRSCHQILQGDRGEFFSPDYLCSNPPLWCNWTIQVPPGKRVHLQLEDFTPASTCHLKTDQIHLDESAGGGGLGPALLGSGSTGNHRILEKCWETAEYTSLSGIVHVILLIPRMPDPPLRGFYGHYRSISDVIPTGSNVRPKNASDSGSREKQKPPDDTHGNRSDSKTLPDSKGSSKEMPSGSVKPSLNQDVSPDTEIHFATPGPSTTMSNEISPGPENPGGEEAKKDGVPWQTLKVHSEGDATGEGRGERRGVAREEDEDENDALWRPLASDADSSTVMEKKKRKKTERPHADGPGTVTPSPLTITHSPWNDTRFQQVVSTTVKPTTKVKPTTTPGQVDTNIPTPKVEAAKKTVTEANFKMSPMSVPKPHTERTYLHHTLRNRTHHPHFPGAFLFEVSVEVSFSPRAGESWDQWVPTLLPSLKNMVKEKLSSNAPTSISSKRIKRLSSGALFLLWLHFDEGQEGTMMHRVLHAAAQGLKGRSVGVETEGVIAYVSVTDVNECSTQLSQCDLHAECVNRFGTYACQCLPGYMDKSRTSPGGTVCIEPTTTVCSWSSPAVLRGIYCVCFLLSFLIALLLLTMAAMYRRRHQGAFLLRCQGHSNGSGLATVAAGDRAPDDNNNNNDGGRSGGCLTTSGDYHRPLPPAPPTPPTRRFKEGSDGTGSLDPPLRRSGPRSRSDGFGNLASDSIGKR